MSSIEQLLKQSSTILIADDSEMNRAILADMLGSEYTIVEAENGHEALEQIRTLGTKLSLVLLDIVMPELDGFGVLAEMNREGWIEDVPVIMISAERGAEQIERAYALGATDFISRPFDALIVHKRVVNTILLYAKQKQLVGMVAQQMYEKEQQSNMMIEILSHIVEFRNGESGLHIRHVHVFTEMILNHLNQKAGGSRFTPLEISTISTASALHDIGKISIPETILNKPGKLTPEEFDRMKTHTIIGAQMLEGLPIYQDIPLVRTACEICRWHHERYDGKGYPDGLKGDDIPISAQVVALADVYDALTSPRVYKAAIPHGESIRMILAGECGAFDPLLLECLSELDGDICDAFRQADPFQSDLHSFHNVTEALSRNKDLPVSKRTLRLLENERTRHDFFAALSNEIQFEFTLFPPVVHLTPFSAQKLGFPEEIRNPTHDPHLLNLISPKDLFHFSDLLRGTSPGQPIVELDCRLNLNGEKRWHRILARATWSEDEPPRYLGAIGKAVDIHDSRTQMDKLARIAATDALTGLFNHASAREKIVNRLEERPDGHFALVIFDLDFFKSANDSRGHLFGDRLLTHLAGRLRHVVRGGDIVARVGGDEFLIFLEYKADPQAAIQRIFNALTGEYDGFSISLSMGIAQTDRVGFDYDTLFHAADNALYAVKRGGRGRYLFYDNSMHDTLSSISPIVAGPEEEQTEEGDHT